MSSNTLKLAGALAAALAWMSAPVLAQAAPIPSGACCNVFNGCCGAPSGLQEGDSVVEGGVGFGECRITTEGSCNGIADTYKGNGTTCEQFCPISTTTTLPPMGACCHLFNGCCAAPAELTGVPGGGSGECRESLPGECNGIADTYKGDGTTCEEFCPLPTTTTSTTLPLGACCEPLGTCLDVTEQNCVIGTYQGDGTECASVECTQPTTTTVPDTTTTTVYIPTTTLPDTTTTTEPVVVLCGDANGDGEITSVDALIALKTSVGTAVCPLSRCDYNGSGETTSSDALAILRVAVGQVVVPMCPIL